MKKSYKVKCLTAPIHVHCYTAHNDDIIKSKFDNFIDSCATGLAI